MENANDEAEKDGVSPPEEKNSDVNISSIIFTAYLQVSLYARLSLSRSISPSQFNPFALNHTAKPPRPRVTFILVTTITAAVIGSSAVFGYNFGVLNSPQQVYLFFVCFALFFFLVNFIWLVLIFHSPSICSLSLIRLVKMSLAQCLLSSPTWR